MLFNKIANVPFSTGPLFFSEIPYDVIVDFLKSNHIVIPLTLEETYQAALSFINQSNEVIVPKTKKEQHQLALSLRQSIAQPIDDWIQAYNYLDNNDIELNDLSKGYLHMYGYDSYNTLTIPKNYQTLIKIIRENLNLTFDLPDELVLVATLNCYDKIINLKNVLRNYGNHTNKSLAHIGDRVCQIVITNLVMKINNTCYDKQFTQIQQLVTNETFRCLINEKYLCDVVSGGKLQNKACPDLFESIIGAIYYWYGNILKQSNVIEFIEKWLIDTFNFDIIVRDWFNNHIKPCQSKQHHALNEPVDYFTKIYKEYTLPSNFDYTIIIFTEYFQLKQLNVELDYFLFELLLLSTSNNKKFYGQKMIKTSIVGCVTKDVLSILGKNSLKMINAHLYYDLMLTTQPLNYIYPKIDIGDASKFHELFSKADTINCYLNVFDDIIDFLGLFDDQINNFLCILGSLYYWAYFIKKIDPIQLVINFMDLNFNYKAKVYEYIKTGKTPCDYNEVVIKTVKDLGKYFTVVDFDQIEPLLKNATLLYEPKYLPWATKAGIITLNKILTIRRGNDEFLVEVNKQSTNRMLYSPSFNHEINVSKYQNK